MPVSEEFIEYAMDQLETLGEVSCRRMFGGAGLFLGGAMFALIADDTLYLKANAATVEPFISRNCRQFKPWTHKDTLMPYWEVPPEILEDAAELTSWAGRSLNT